MGMREFGKIPWLWPGEEFVVIAGGPSVLGVDLSVVRNAQREGRVRVVAVNNSYLIFPSADVLFFMDAKWYGWHKDREEFRGFGGMKVTVDKGCLGREEGRDEGLIVVEQAGQYGLSLRSDRMFTGFNSGYCAINLCVLLGGRAIYLLGFDMKMGQGRGGSEDKSEESRSRLRSHWHDGHPDPLLPGVFDGVMLPAFDSLPSPLREAGVRVVNCSENSALRVFPFGKIEEIFRPWASPFLEKGGNSERGEVRNG